MSHKALFLTLLSILFLGCSSGGGSSGEFTSGNASSGAVSQPTVSVGTLRFDFARAQTALLVPNSTVRLRFLFTDQAGGEGALVLETTREFALSITITDVPVSARSVRVTALDVSGQPILTAIASVSVLADRSSTVNFPTFVEVTPVEVVIDPTEVELRVGGERQFLAILRLSDGSSVEATGATWSSSDGAVLVSSNGRATAVSPGSAKVRAALGGMSAEADVAVLPALPEVPGIVTLESFVLSRRNLTLDVGASLVLTATGTFSNSTVRVLSQVQDGLSFASTDDQVASVDDEGRVVAVGVGEATLTATVGELTQSVEVTVSQSPTQQRPVVDLHLSEIPTVTLDSGPYLIAANVTVTDVHDDLEGGVLRVRNYRSLSLKAPDSPNIGTVSGDGSSTLSVTFTQGVTPGMVAQFLRGITVPTDGPQNDLYFEINLDNGYGQTAYAYSQAYLRSDRVLDLTVDPSSPLSETNYHNPQEAIGRVEEYGADGSTITLSAGDFRSGGPELGNFTNYRFVTPHFTIRGANAGVPVGTSPQLRGPETVIASLTFDNYTEARVTVDGLTFDPNQTTSPDGPFAIVSMNRSYTVRNCIFAGSKGDFAISHFGSSRGISVVEDCRIENIGGAMGIYGAYCEIRRNVLRNLNFGIYFESLFFTDPNFVSVTITDNLFENQDYYWLQATTLTESSVEIAGNAFQGTGRVSLTLGSYSLDVRGNWWGQASGPLPGQLDNNSRIADILATPFLTTNPIP